MSSYFKRNFNKIAVTVLLFLLCLLKLMDNNVSEKSFLYQWSNKIVHKPVIPPNCSCSDKDGNTYNFCYMNPNNTTMIGKKFDCKHLEAVRKLGLLDTDYIDLSRQEMTDPQFVTAISESYIYGSRRQLKNLHNLWPNKTIVVFDMGLGEYRKEYESNPLVDLRNFTFDQFPKYVTNMKEYRWKPIVIAKMLKEFDLSPVYSLLRCKNKNSRAAETVSHPKYLENYDIEAMRKSCNKSTYLLHNLLFHSILATTQEGMYDFLPMNMDIAKVPMYEAGMVTVVRTKEAVENIVKWYVLCALEEHCMGPPGAELSCRFKENTLTMFANCHRYDQSAVNILSANLFNGDVNLYGSGLKGYLTVNREG